MIIATGISRKSLVWERKSVSWEQLVKRFSRTTYTDETEAEYQAMDKDRKINCKDIGGVVCGELSGPQRTDKNLVNRCVLALDIDFGTADTWLDYETLCDWECLMHTTHSSTKDKPRYRMYFPLKRTVTKAEYEPLGRMVASMIDIEQFDDTTFEATRLMFWPSTPKDGEFQVWHHEGPWIDPDEVLGLYEDWENVASWPKSSRVTQELQVAKGEMQQDPTTKTGIVGAFCRVYNIYTAIDRYLSDIYTPTDERDRYTYTGSDHHAKGLVVYDDGLFAKSFHQSDPAHIRPLCNAFDLVRLHKCPATDEKQSYRDMLSFLQSDSDVIAEFDSMHTSPFGDLDIDDLRRSDVDFTETGNALKLKDHCQKVMRYDRSRGWMVYDGQIWEESEALANYHLFRLNDDMMEKAMALLEKHKPENVDDMKKSEYPEEYQLALNYYAWAKQSRSYKVLSNTMKLAKSMMDGSDDFFDGDPWVLNTPGGLVDLKNGEISDHQPWHRCTMCTAVTPSWSAKHDEWDAFLDRVTGGDKGTQSYLQQIAGMSLVGAVFEENLIMVYGPGGNGKSTFFRIWLDLLGDYAGTIRNEVLIGDKHGGESYGAHQLRGKRLVITSEFEESTRLSGSLLKRLTSRDYISANVKYKDPVTFLPTHTLILHTNHLPKLRSVDYGTVRRIAVVPFNTTFKQEERKTNFAAELIEAEGPAILAWMIDGAIQFYGNQMQIKKPDLVQTVTKDYTDNEDMINSFIKDCCVRDGSAFTGTLFQSFRSWLQENDIHWAGGAPAFRKALEAHGFTIRKTNKGAQVDGLMPADEEDLL